MSGLDWTPNEYYKPHYTTGVNLSTGNRMKDKKPKKNKINKAVFKEEVEIDNMMNKLDKAYEDWENNKEKKADK